MSENRGKEEASYEELPELLFQYHHQEKMWVQSSSLTGDQ